MDHCAIVTDSAPGTASHLDYIPAKMTRPLQCAVCSSVVISICVSDPSKLALFWQLIHRLVSSPQFVCLY